jgi:hypothetical protein
VLRLEDVHVKYDDIISKVRAIEEKTQQLEYVIILEKQMDDKGVKNDGRPSLKVEPYRHSHCQESWQERQILTSTLSRK